MKKNKALIYYLKDSFLPILLLFIVVTSFLVWAEYSINKKSINFIKVSILNTKSGQMDGDEESSKLFQQKLLSNVIDLSSMTNTQASYRLAIDSIKGKYQSTNYSVEDLNDLAVLYFTIKDDKSIKPLVKDLSDRREEAGGQGRIVILNNLSIYYFYKKEFSKTESLLLESIKKKKTGLALFLLAKINIKKGNVRNAQIYFRKSIKISEKSKVIKMHSSFASELSKKKYFKLSLFHYDKCLAIDSNYFKAKINKAIIYKKQEKIILARELYIELLRAQPDSIKANYNYSIFLHSQGDDKGAILSLQKVLLYDENHLPARKILAQIYFKNKDYSNSLVQYRWIYKKSPGSPLNLLNLGRVYYKKKKFKKAEKYFLLAIQKKGGDYPKAWLKLGEVYFLQKMFLEAEKVVFDAIQLNQNFSEAYKMMGDIMVATGRRGKAFPMYMRAIETNKTSIGPLKSIADFHMNLGEEELALSYYMKILKKHPDHINANIKAGEILTKQKKYREAIEYQIRVIQMKPKKSVTLYHMGKNYYDLKEYKKALEVFKASFQFSDRENVEFKAKNLRRQALCYRRLKKYSRALEALGESIQLKNDYAVARYERAKIMWITKDKVTALRELDLAINLSNNPCNYLKKGLRWGNEKYRLIFEERCLK